MSFPLGHLKNLEDLSFNLMGGNDIQAQAVIVFQQVGYRCNRYFALFADNPGCLALVCPDPFFGGSPTTPSTICSRLEKREARLSS